MEAEYKAGVTHDIVLVGSKTGPDKVYTGLMLAEEKGVKKWRFKEAPTLAPRFSTEGASYAQYLPEQEMVEAWTSWRDGFGQYRHINPNRYLEAHNVDTRFAHQLILGPLINATGNGAGGTALGQANRWNSICEALGNLYIMTHDGTDTQIWVWDTTNNYWTEVEKFAADAAAEGLCGFGNATSDYIIAAHSGDIYHSTNGLTYTKVVENCSKGMAVVKDTLWGASASGVRSCSNPTAPWVAEQQIGDRHADLTALLCMNNILWAGREDGLFSWDLTSVVNLLPEYRRLENAYNFSAMIGWYNRAYLSTGEDGLLCYDPQNPEAAVDISPSLYSASARITAMGVRIAALARDDNWLYAIIAPKAQGEYAYVLAGRWQLSHGDTIFSWHPIAEFDTADSANVNLAAAWLTTVQGGNPRLWLGESGSTAGKPGWIRLSKGHQNPKDDTTYLFAGSGYLITSWVDHNMVHVDKAWTYVEVEATNLSSTVYVTFWYRIDTETSWTKLGDVKKNGKSIISFEALADDLDKVTGRRIQLKVELTTSSSSLTPVVESWALHGVLRPPVKQLWEFSVLCADHIPTLQGAEDSQTAAEIMQNLQTYRDSVWPVKFYDIDGVAWDVHIMDKAGAIVEKEEGKIAERVIDILALEARLR